MILCTIMRDAHRYLGTWTRQIEKLAQICPDRLSVVVAEGDSNDETYKELIALREHLWVDLPITVLKVETGGPYWESQNIAARWRQLAVVCNVALNAAVSRLAEDEVLVYCESDLIWAPETIVALAERTKQYPAVAPMSMQAGRFYDVWGYRKNERRFSPYPPYHPEIGSGMVAIDSAGSCTAFSNAAARVIAFDHNDCILGLGRSLYANGMSLWLDPSLTVRHPL